MFAVVWFLVVDCVPYNGAASLQMKQTGQEYSRSLMHVAVLDTSAVVFCSASNATEGVVQVYLHGGNAVATGHGCLNDLWQFDVRKHTWTRVPVAASRQHISDKLASVSTSVASACQHTLAVDSSGSFIIHGGSSSRGDLNRTLQVVTQLVSNVPGGAPNNMAMASRLRPAGTVAALAMCRYSPASSTLLRLRVP